MKEVNLALQPDDIGPEKVFCVFDPVTRMQGFLVIDNTALGIGQGGIRLAPDSTLSETMQLARAMTWKNAMADLPFGGAAGAIICDPLATDRERIIRAFLQSLSNIVSTEYVCGLDMQLREEDAAVILDELCHRHASTGKPACVGGIHHEQLGLNGYALVKAVMTGCDFLGIRASDARLLIKGLGTAGRSVVKFAGEECMTIVAVAEGGNVVHSPAGLDAATLLKAYSEQGTVAHCAKALRLKPGAELELPCEVMVLCGEENLDLAEVKKIKARIVAECGDRSVPPEVQNYLNAADILYLPNSITDLGNMIGAYVAYNDGTPLNAIERVSGTMTRNIQTILCESRLKGITTQEAGLALARERVVMAMQAKSLRTR